MACERAFFVRISRAQRPGREKRCARVSQIKRGKASVVRLKRIAASVFYVLDKASAGDYVFRN